ENAYYSVITPEGCAAILWKDRAYSSKAAEALKLTASDLIKLGIIDDIIPEPLGGAHRNWDEAAGILKKYLEQKIEELFSVSKKNLLENRYLKYRKIGFFNE
ncbi:MAG TPA: hypothetical protein PLN24_08645, partial [Victivallales bacterium]|nr:hypothetical protein [Victivallales bacterium]